MIANLKSILEEWSFRCKDGIVDVNDPIKVAVLQEILNENNVDVDILKEIKGVNIKKGQKFTLNSDFGDLSKGDEVEVIEVEFIDEEEMKITIQNQLGKVDHFYIDRNDDIDELNESFLEEAE